MDLHSPFGTVDDASSDEGDHIDPNITFSDDAAPVSLTFPTHTWSPYAVTDKLAEAAVVLRHPWMTEKHRSCDADRRLCPVCSPFTGDMTVDKQIEDVFIRFSQEIPENMHAFKRRLDAYIKDRNEIIHKHFFDWFKANFGSIYAQMITYSKGNLIKALRQISKSLTPSDMLEDADIVTYREKRKRTYCDRAIPFCPDCENNFTEGWDETFHHAKRHKYYTNIMVHTFDVVKNRDVIFMTKACQFFLDLRATFTMHPRFYNVFYVDYPPDL